MVTDSPSASGRELCQSRLCSSCRIKTGDVYLTATFSRAGFMNSYYYLLPATALFFFVCFFHVYQRYSRTSALRLILSPASNAVAIFRYMSFQQVTTKALCRLLSDKSVQLAPRLTQPLQTKRPFVCGFLRPAKTLKLGSGSPQAVLSLHPIHPKPPPLPSTQPKARRRLERD